MWYTITYQMQKSYTLTVNKITFYFYCLIVKIRQLIDITEYIPQIRTKWTVYYVKFQVFYSTFSIYGP